MTRNQNNNKTANKGEWSEFYAFLKILSDRELPAADKNLKATDRMFVFQKVYRQDEHEQPIRIYNLTEGENEIPIYENDESGEPVKIFDTSKLGEKTKRIFKRITEGSGSFEIREAEDLMNKLLCTNIKASNEEKADIVAVIHDRISETSPMLGFSVKSMAGGASTLLNAGQTTNFIYKVTGFAGNVSEINEIKGRTKIRDRINTIMQKGGAFEFDHVASKTFEQNMRAIDTMLPEFIAHMLFIFFTSNTRNVSDLVREISENERMCERYKLTYENYAYKIHNFLDAVALGMVPSKLWDGFIKAHGGYIVVKEDGEVVCYHLYNREEFQTYLFENTKFEGASSSRHSYGTLYEESGNLYFNLNLQIRFLK